MSKQITEQIKFCKECGKDTLQRKNSKSMSWGMHIILTIITLGGWGVVWLVIFIWHSLDKTLIAATTKWLCSECGKKVS